jgi:peptidyl-dipeptidase A
VALGAVFIGLCSAAPLNTDEEEARKFATEFSEKAFKCLNNMANTTFSASDKDFGEMMEALSTVVDTADTLAELVEGSKKFDYKNFKNEELKYIFQLISQFAEEAIVGSDEFIEIITKVKMLEDLASDKDVPSFEDEEKSLAYYPDIQNIIVKSNNPKELLHYWTSWRDKNAIWAVNHFITLVKGLQHAANLTGLSDYDYWMGDFDIKEMDEVMTKIQPFYNQMHGFIRYKLNKKYGDSVVSSNGLIPDHIFQQVLAQAWTDNSIIDDEFPLKDLPYNSILEENNFDTLKLYKTADQFYQSLGFDPIPDDYWGKRFRMKSNEDEGDCKASLFAYTSNVYMEYCQKMDFRKFLQAHGYMGEIYYAKEKGDLPAYYYYAHDLEYPVGEAVILSASTPKHLTALGLVTDTKFTDDVLMNRLFRLSIHTMINIPLYYVHTRVMADLFSGATSMTDLNKHYWALMDKYVGVGPPEDRVSDTFDFPQTFYLELNENKQATKFDSEVLGYQFYKKMCSISGQYPKEPLQNCDFYGSKEVGDALKKMMKLGSSKTFYKVLEAFLPEDPKLNAGSLLEYYHPIEMFVTEKNHNGNVKLGWTHLDKVIGTVQMPTTDNEED